MLHTYPAALKILGVEDLIQPEQVESQQIEWLRHISQFYGDDKEFFKPSWVRLNDKGYGTFIDSEDPKYCIFTYAFDCRGGSNWTRIHIFEDVNELLHNIEDPEFLANRMSEVKLASIKVNIKDYEVMDEDETFIPMGNSFLDDSPLDGPFLGNSFLGDSSQDDLSLDASFLDDLFLDDLFLDDDESVEEEDDDDDDSFFDEFFSDEEE